MRTWSALPILALLIPGAAQAQAPDPALVVTATNMLNVRSGPRPFYPATGAIEPGATAELVGCVRDSRWCAVRHHGETGWIDGNYVVVERDGAKTVVNEGRDALRVPQGPFDSTSEAQVEDRPVVGAFVDPKPGVDDLYVVAVDPGDAALAYARGADGGNWFLDGEAMVGSLLPDTVMQRMVPETQYAFVRVNDEILFVDPKTSRVVHVDRSRPLPSR